MPEYLPTILIIAVLAVICFIAVLSIIKRANKGCCGAGGGDIEEHIEKDTSGFTHRYSVKIGGMHCEKCSSQDSCGVQPAGRRLRRGELEGRQGAGAFKGSAPGACDP